MKGILNFTSANAVYLQDKKTDLYYDIKNDFYDLTLPAGFNNTQFKITFKKNITLGVDETARQSFVVYQNNPSKNLNISNLILLDLASCNLYDVAAKLIFNKK